MKKHKFSFKELGFTLYLTYLSLGYKWYVDDNRQYYVASENCIPPCRIGTLEDVCIFLTQFIH